MPATPSLARWAPLIGAILSEVAASLSLKASLEAPWLLVVVVVGYLTSFVLLAVTLRAGMGLGVAYGIWGAVGVALTAIMAAVLFDEPLTPPMVVGVGLIGAGVLCVELGSQRAARARATTTGSTTDTGAAP